MIRRTIILILLIGIGIFGYRVVSGNKAIAAEDYNNMKEKAEAFEADGYYMDAIECYSALNDMKNERETEKKILLLYNDLGDDYEFEDLANDYLKKTEDVEIYRALIENCLEEYDYRKGYRYLEQALKTFPDDEEVLNLEIALDGKYSEAFLDLDDAILMGGNYVAGTKEEEIRVYNLNGEPVLKGFDIDKINGLFVKETDDGNEYLWNLALKDGYNGFMDDKGYSRASVDGYKEVLLISLKTNDNGIYNDRVDDINLNMNDVNNEDTYDEDVKNAYEDSGDDGKRDEALVPYLEGELWGYRNSDGVTVIEPSFEMASGFTEDGYALVKEDDIYKVINLYKYKTDESLF